MTVERALRLMAGVAILLSLALTHWVSDKWLWFTAFVGLNLLQSAFTNWCPAMSLFRALGLRDGGGGCGSGKRSCATGSGHGCCGSAEQK